MLTVYLCKFSDQIHKLLRAERRALRTDLGLEYVLVLVEMFAGRQRPEEPGQALDVPGVLQDLADARHLLLREPEHERVAAGGGVFLGGDGGWSR